MQNQSKIQSKKLDRLKNSFEKIIDVIIESNDDLKEGLYDNVQSKVDSIFKSQINYFKTNFDLKESEKFGLNLQIMGLFTPFLFPYALYSNNFRKHIIRKLQKFLNQQFDYESLCKFLSLEITKTSGSKRGG